MVIHQDIWVADDHTHIDIDGWLNTAFKFEWTKLKYFDIKQSYNKTTEVTHLKRFRKNNKTHWAEGKVPFLLYEVKYCIDI